ncbi:MAG: hypothetical protein ABEN55_21160 [Bradymonadaceae bacterium]
MLIHIEPADQQTILFEGVVPMDQVDHVRFNRERTSPDITILTQEVKIRIKTDRVDDIQARFRDDGDVVIRARDANVVRT